MSNGHALFSPSRAARDLRCAGAAAMEAGLRDNDTVHADDGSASHTLGARALTTGKPCADYTETITVNGTDAHGQPITRTYPPDEERAAFVQIYVDAINQRIATLRSAYALVELHVEVRVPVGHITGEADAYGTSDAVIVATSADGAMDIHVVDLKYGMGVAVDAANNEQGLCYLAGAVEKFGLLGDFRSGTIVIHQPRISTIPTEWTVTPDFLDGWLSEAREGYKLATLAYTHRANWIGKSTDYLEPGEKQCRFCKAKGSCPALADYVQKAVGADFKDLTISLPATVEAPPDVTPKQFVALSLAAMPSDQLGWNLRAVETLVEEWCRATRAEVERRIFDGQTVPGYKLVEGRRGNRAWIDEGAAEAALKAMRLKMDEMYSMKVISPTQAEKLLKSKPRRWKKIEQLVTRADGKASVASDDDPRPAISAQATAVEFQDLGLAGGAEDLAS